MLLSPSRPARERTSSVTYRYSRALPSIAVLVVGLASTCGTVPAAAQTFSPTPSPTPVSVTHFDLVCPKGIVRVGETFSVAIGVEAAQGSVLRSASTRLRFGASFDFSPPASAGEACPNDGFVSCGGPDGSVTCACLSRDRMPDGVIVRAKLRLKSCPAIGGIRLDQPQALDTSNHVVTAVAEGSCAITCR